MCCMENRSTHLSTWVSADLKERFATAAARQGLSESALLKRLVEQMLAGAGDELTAIQRPAPIARDARVTVRLVPAFAGAAGAGLAGCGMRGLLDGDGPIRPSGAFSCARYFLVPGFARAFEEY